MKTPIFMTSSKQHFRLLVSFVGMLILSCTHSFAQSDSTVIVQITDTQFGFFENNTGFEKETELYTKAVRRINELKPDFVVITGDFVNDSKNILQIGEFKRITSLIHQNVPVYLSPGNHDLGQSPTKNDFNFYFSNYGRGTDRFSFKHKNLAFIGINSVIVKSNKNKKEEKKQFRWLRNQLRKAKKSGSIVLFTHYPFFLYDFNEKESYSNQSVEVRDRYFQLFERYGVDAIFAGHLHNNAEASHNGISMITTNAVGKPLGNAEPGMRIITITSEGIKSRYISIE